MLAVLDHTRTAMGARLLRRAVLEPLRDGTAIAARLNAVEFLFRHQHTLAAVREGLRRIADLERLAGRVALARAHPRDLRAIAAGVRAAQEVAAALQAPDASAHGVLAVPLRSAAAAAEPVAALIEKALVDEPPLSITEGGIMRPGHDEKLDRLRAAEEDAETLLQAYLEEERAATGIAGLKLRHNRVLGWYLEVTPSQAARVPGHFVRRQSLVGRRALHHRAAAAARPRDRGGRRAPARVGAHRVSCRARPGRCRGSGAAGPRKDTGRCRSGAESGAGRHRGRLYAADAGCAGHRDRDSGRASPGGGGDVAGRRVRAQ